MQSEFESLDKKHSVVLSDKSGFKSALMPSNIYKNRYANILAYEKTRVVLQKNIEGDYINANWTDSPLCKKAFICSQAPTRRTVNDFWNMVWEQEVHSLVCLSSPVEDDLLYFPRTVDQEILTSDFIIILSNVWKVLDDGVEIRRLTVKNVFTAKTRKLYHLHYLDWPDFGTPRDTIQFLDFIEIVYVISLKHHFTKPVLIHCSAGVGRTGTFCSVYNGLLMIRYHNTCNVPWIVDMLRKDRPGAVQTIEQYKFIYKAIFTSISRSRVSACQKKEETSMSQTNTEQKVFETFPCS